MLWKLTEARVHPTKGGRTQAVPGWFPSADPPCSRAPLRGGQGWPGAKGLPSCLLGAHRALHLQAHGAHLTGQSRLGASGGGGSAEERVRQSWERGAGRRSSCPPCNFSGRRSDRLKSRRRCPRGISLRPACGGPGGPGRRRQLARTPALLDGGPRSLAAPSLGPSQTLASSQGPLRGQRLGASRWEILSLGLKRRCSHLRCGFSFITDPGGW